MGRVLIRFRLVFSLLFPLIFAAVLILRPEIASGGAAKGLSLCFSVLIPSLFPFFICSNLISELRFGERLGQKLQGIMGPLFGIGGAGSAALVLGLLGGYPAGAQSAASLYRSGQLSKKETEQLLRFCNNSGPAFIFGVLGAGIFHSAAVGALLYSVHLFCAVLTGLLLRRGNLMPSISNRQPPPPDVPGFSGAFTVSVKRAGNSMLQVCLFVVIFSVFSACLSYFLSGWLPCSIQPVILGMLELSNGAAALAECTLAPVFRLVTASFLLGFGGLSVFAQTCAILEEAGLSCSGLLLSKLLHGLLSAAVMYILCTFFLPESLSAAAAFSESGGATSLPVSLFLFFLLAAILSYRIRKITCGNGANSCV